MGLFLAPTAAAEDLIVSRAMFEDKAGTLTITEATQQQFSPVQSIFSDGYSDSVYWLRVRVRAPRTGSEVVLNIGPTLIDEVRLYESGELNPREWITRVTGDRYAYADRDRKDIALGFVVSVTGAEQTFYLRIKTTSNSQITVEGLEPHQAERNGQQSNLLRNIFIGLMLWALVWAIDHYIVGREPFVGLFALYQGIHILYGLSATGNLAPYIPYQFPQLADWVSNILACAVPFMFLLLSRALLRPYAPRWTQGFAILLLVFPVQLGAMAFGYARVALSINVLLSIAAPWYCVMLAFAATRESAPSRRMLQMIYIGLAVLALLAGLTGLKTEWILLTEGVISAGLMSAMLYARLRQARRDAQQAQAHARTDYLTGLFNRRYFVELAERALARAAHSHEPLSLLMIDIDHFKVVNDTWGHNGGDIVLQRIADLIRGALRQDDILGRIGGEEFAVVLVGADQENALTIAQKICAIAADTVIALPGGRSVRVTLSVGLSQLKEQDSNLDGLLHKADKALYQAKGSGRNMVTAID